MAACMGAEGTMSVAWLMQISEGTDQVFRGDRAESGLTAKFGMQKAVERFLLARLDKLPHVVADAFIAAVQGQRHDGLRGAPHVPLRNQRKEKLEGAFVTRETQRGEQSAPGRLVHSRAPAFDQQLDRGGLLRFRQGHCRAFAYRRIAVLQISGYKLEGLRWLELHERPEALGRHR